MALLDDLADRLSSQGVATTGTNLFKSVMPASPDELVALAHTAGPEPVRGMAGSPAQALAERPHVQVLARSTRPDNAEWLARKVFRALDGLGSLTLNGVVYHSIFALQSPFFLNNDEAGRYIYACNYEVVRAMASSS